jgi:hypothetical protein
MTYDDMLTASQAITEELGRAYRDGDHTAKSAACTALSELYADGDACLAGRLQYALSLVAIEAYFAGLDTKSAIRPGNFHSQFSG